MTTAIQDLEIACLVRIFSHLSPKECARVACVHPLWNLALSDDVIWKSRLAANFAAYTAVNPDNIPAESYRSAYSNWHRTYADVAGPFLARTLACWNTIKAWLATHSPQILATLNPGATANEVAEAEASLGHPLPLAARCIYRVVNGQDLKLREQPTASNDPPANLLMGLFGTLVFYEHVTSNAMKPLSEVVMLTLLLQAARPLGARLPLLGSRQVLFATSFRFNDKLCVLDCDKGGLYLHMHDRDWPMVPAQDSYPGACDGLLRWMEEYARRLTSGWYGGCEGDSALTGSGVQLQGAINLFPRVYPAATTAITRGVQVSWSSVLVPQQSRQGRLLFAYSVRFSLLTEEQQLAAAARLAQEQQQWQQQQHQELPSISSRGDAEAPVSVAAGAARSSGSSSNTAAAATDEGTLHTAPPTLPEVAGAIGSAVAGSITSSGADITHVAGVEFSGDPAVAEAAAAATTAAMPSPPPAQVQSSSRSVPRSRVSNLARFTQERAIGPCDASAGAAYVPDALQTPPVWAAAAPAAAANMNALGRSSSGAGNGISTSRHGSDATAAAGVGFAAAPAGLNDDPSSMLSPTAAALAASSITPPPTSCQLETRHWSILDMQAAEIDTVSGEGVVGLFPLLVPGGEEFSYASCIPVAIPAGCQTTAAAAGSSASESSAAAAAALEGGEYGTTARSEAVGPWQLAGKVVGAMEGSFDFVEGSLMQRSGPGFVVKCSRLVLAVPEYIY